MALANSTIVPNSTASCSWNGCEFFFKPVFVEWEYDTRWPVVGTTYLYVDPEASTTSTSVKCRSSELFTYTLPRTRAEFAEVLSRSYDDQCKYSTQIAVAGVTYDTPPEPQV